MMEKLVILGATGTIGKQTLQVVLQHPDRFEVYGVAAYTQVDKMVEICVAFQPRYATMTHTVAAKELRLRLAEHRCCTEVLEGKDALISLACDPQVTQVMAAIVGFAGLASTFAAVKAGKKVLLANKEALVTSGSLLIPLLEKTKASLIPVDSEHNALFQCVARELILGKSPPGIEKMWLTASGGAFRNYSMEALKAVTPAQACKHPNWQMGAKITVDSSTLMNKGLELMEAHFLFGLSLSELGVLIHPESAIHGLVQYVDGALLAGLSYPDMRIPIAHALAFPERIANDVPRLDLIALKQLQFELPDTNRFPCLALAQAALEAGQYAMIVLNAANEVAVEAFLAHQIGFLDIPVCIEKALQQFGPRSFTTVEAICDFDADVRRFVYTALKLKEMLPA